MVEVMVEVVMEGRGGGAGSVICVDTPGAQRSCYNTVHIKQLGIYDNKA